MSDNIFYVMHEGNIIFSGSSIDCKRISKKVQGSKIEPPLTKRKTSIQSQFDFVDR